MNWNDLRYLLAVQRGGSLSAAARLLKVDDTTVARRVKALSAAFDDVLVRREPNGGLGLTALGESVARRADHIERELDQMSARMKAEQDECAGTVRLTSVPIIVNRLLAPVAAELLAARPALSLEMVPDSRDLSLTRREADMALRLARPKSGGTAVRMRRLAVLPYAAYASVRHTEQDAISLPWLSYEDAMAHLAQARWMAKVAGRREERLANLKVHDAETALEAAAAGVGRTLLPSIIAEHDARLRRLHEAIDLPARELWLIVHAELLGLPRISAVIRWVEEAIANRMRP